MATNKVGILGRMNPTIRRIQVMATIDIRIVMRMAALITAMGPALFIPIQTKDIQPIKTQTRAQVPPNIIQKGLGPRHINLVRNRM